jgi:hypothetical protein
VPAGLRAGRSGFAGARLVRLPGHRWAGIVAWNSPEDTAALLGQRRDLPGRTAFSGPVRGDAAQWADVIRHRIPNSDSSPT